MVWAPGSPRPPALAAPQQATEIAIAQPYQITHYGAIALENHLIDARQYWSKQGQLPWREIGPWLDHPAALWGAGESSSSGRNNRLCIGKEDGTSLYLVATERLRLLVGQRTAQIPDSKRSVRGEFVYNGTSYCMDVTDPLVERNYLAETDGQYEVRQPVLCVSLGDPYQGHFYKLIAAVLSAERCG